MEGNLRKDSELLIISDTAMWSKDESVFVFEPTLREVEHLCLLFKRVRWVGYDFGSSPAQNSRISSVKNLELVPISCVRGGKTFWAKLKVLHLVPRLVMTLAKEMKPYSLVHTRGPSLPAFFVALISLFDRRRKYWHKYAGNWGQRNPPLAYALQKYILKKNIKNIVTVNGHWPNQRSHTLSFENPTLTKNELSIASAFGINKTFEAPFRLCFVGSLVPLKGVRQFLIALQSFQFRELIAEVLIVGDGPERRQLEDYAKTHSLNVNFLGGLRREAINEVYKKCHALILPSEGEGFPKVVAEAAAFGCVPIVTDVSAIGQYIQTDVNGILLENNQPETIKRGLVLFLSKKENAGKMGKEVMNLCSLFTFERYLARVKSEIVDSL